MSIWNKITEQETAIIVERYLAGDSPAVIATALGRNDRSVRRIVHDLGVSRDKRAAAIVRLSKQDCSQMFYARTRTAHGFPLVHRCIAEAMIGRKLRPNEIVHHKNENKRDNRPENLEVMTRSEHIRYHNLKRWANGTFRKWRPRKYF